MQITQFTLLTFVPLLFAQCSQKDSSLNSKPNIVLIMADDMGRGEIGVYGQKIIKTPNMDSLAQHGIRFTNSYSGNGVSAPSRCVLLSGLHGGHAYIRSNDEYKERGDVWNFQKVEEDSTLEGQRPIPNEVYTLGEMLKDDGYNTACVGKWGLGNPGGKGQPNDQGFDFFYGYICQRQAHTQYPTHLWNNRNKDRLNNKYQNPYHKFPKDEDINNQKNFDKYQGNEYAPQKMTEKALQYIEQNKEHPFFLYFASNLPHVPLQVPPKWRDMYKETILNDPSYDGSKWYTPAFKPRATYAGMVSFFDDQIGQIIQKLKELGLDQNTIVIVTSDNGPTYNGGSDSPFFNSARPFKSEFGYAKGFLREGGIRAPLIVYWPEKIKKASISNHLCGFWDYMSTLADVANITEKPKTDGVSFYPTLVGKGKQQKHDYLYWELDGQQAIRYKKWKAYRPNAIKNPSELLELYDLENDSIESINVAKKYPKIVKQINSMLNEAHQTPAIHIDTWDIPRATTIE